MQQLLQFNKLFYFNICKFNLKLPLLVIICLLLINCAQNDSVQLTAVHGSSSISENAININTATAEELEKLPRVGEETARKIIEFREKYGKFRRTEDLIMVHGMSDKKFRALRNLVKVE